MPKEFRYDVKLLIQSVRERPCLWNKSLECYKDRIERRTAWEEVFNILDPRYEEMSLTEKKITGEHVLNKWTNVRDTFVKTLKTPIGKKPKRKYMLHDHLEFLVKVVPEHSRNSDDADQSSAECADQSSAECADHPIFLTASAVKYENDTEMEPEIDPVVFNTRKRPKRKKIEVKESPKKIAKDSDRGSDFDISEVDEVNDPRVMNEDEAFFASLLPSVVRYTEDERLEFRIEVLAIMRKIKENRKWANT